MREEKDLIKKLYDSVPKSSWICLAAGVVTGILSHLYMLTNKLPNWDDLTTFGGYGVGGENGRWMISRLHDMAGIWSVPALNGMLAIIFFSIATCFMLEVLELRSVTSAVLFPFITLEIILPGMR